MDYFALFLFAALIIGASKGGLASAGSLAVPFLAIWVDPFTAAGILLPVFMASDLVGVWLFRREYSAKNILLLVPAGLLGVILAWLLAPYLSATYAALATGLIGFLYCGQAVVKRLNRQDAPVPFHIGRGLFWGTLSGITSFISHTGAPPYQSFMLPQKLPKMDYAGTTTIVFTFVNLFKLPSYASVGMLANFHWPTMMAMIAVAAGGAVLGRRISQWLPSEVYVLVIQILLFVLSTYLVTTALSRIL